MPRLQQRNLGALSSGLEAEHENDVGSWAQAMSAHGRLEMTGGGKNYFATYQSLLPLGKLSRIRRYIDSELEKARLMNGGELPRVYVIPVADSPIPLVIPTTLDPVTTLTAERAAEHGVEALEPFVRQCEALGTMAADTRRREEELEDEGLTEIEIRERINEEQEAGGGLWNSQMEAQLRTRYADDGLSDAEVDERVAADIEAAQSRGVAQGGTRLSSVQHYAQLAVVLGSVTDTVLGAIDEGGEDVLPVDTAITVLEAVGAVCGTVGALVTSVPIAAAVLEILAIVVELIVLILNALRGYLVPAAEGWNDEWRTLDGYQILQDRLRVLVQCDENFLGEGWERAWTKLMVGRTGDEKLEQLKGYVIATALNRGASRVAAAKAIAMRLGGREAVLSLIMCEQIRDWLAYTGVPDDRCGLVYSWLYEARKVTVVRDKHDLLHSGNAVRHIDFTGRTNDWLGSKSGAYCNENWHCGTTDYQCKPNFVYGSSKWYQKCQNLPPASFQRFPESDLQILYEYLRDKLKVTPRPAKHSVDIAILVFEGLGVRPPAWFVRQARVVSIGRYLCLCVPGMTEDRVPDGLQDAYVSVYAPQMWGAICGIGGSLASSGFHELYYALPAPGIPRQMVNAGDVWRNRTTQMVTNIREGRVTNIMPTMSLEQVRALAARRGDTRPAGLGGLGAVGDEEQVDNTRFNLTASEEEYINTVSFRAQLALALAPRGASFGGVLLGAAVVGGLGYAAYRLLKK